jgi:hypothetical protein
MCSTLATTSRCNWRSPVLCISTFTAIPKVYDSCVGRACVVGVNGIFRQLAYDCVANSPAFSELAYQAINSVRYIIVAVMKRLVLVILSCFLNGVLYGQQTISVPIIVEGDQAALLLRDSDLKVEVNHQPVTVSSFTPLAGQHLLYALINGERRNTLWPKGSAQQVDVAAQFLKEVITAGVDIGSLINFSDEYFLDVSDQKDPQQLAAKLMNDRSGSAMYDAVVATADHLARKPDIAGYRKVMFLFCDGEDTLSALTFNQATERVQREGIPLFIFAPSAVKKKTQGKNLSKFALELGGRIYFLPENTKTVSFDAVKQDLARSFLLKIGIPPSQAMETLNVADSSQPKVSIIAPSRIGVLLLTQPVQVEDKKPAYTQERLAELRVKCGPYANTKIEDLESKRVPLPPHECAGVLGWMRDSRVERLYGSEKPVQ